MSRFFCFYIFLSFNLPSKIVYGHGNLASDVLELNYEDIPILLDKSSIRLRIASKKMEANRAREGYLKQSFYPQIALKSSLETFRFGSSDFRTQPIASALASINLYNGGQDELIEEINQSSNTYFEAEGRALKKTQLAASRKLFWEYLFFERLLSLNIEASKQLKDLKKSAIKRINAGTAARSEGIEFELKLYELNLAIEAAKLEKEKVKTALLAELGISDYSDIHIDTKYENPAFWQKKFSHNSSHHRDFLAKYEQQINLKKLNIEKIDLLSRPKLDVFGGVHLYNEREKEVPASWQRFEQVVGVSISINIDTSSINKQEKAGIAAEIQAIESESKADLLDFEKHLKIDDKEMAYLHEKINKFPDHLKLLEKREKLMAEDYKFGVKDSEDVIAVILETLEAKIQYAQIVKDLNSIISHMESYFI
ncbi:MAG: TolC family protein [Oligoflexales bacterium]|nr:TolC family protein [Oligoflexales bacterium]